MQSIINPQSIPSIYSTFKVIHYFETMSEGLSNVACFSMTTLLVVSLANLILLIVMIMEARKKCTGDSEVSDTGYRFGALQGVNRYTSIVNENNLKEDPKFMAALVLLKGSSLSLICGAVIISKFWTLTTAHCCGKIKIYPFEQLKLSSNNHNWRKGKKHSVENLVQHINYTATSSSYNVCLIKAGSPFKELREKPVTLAGSSYRYVTDTSAATFGWSSKNNNLYSISVNLISFQRCKTLMKIDRVDETMVCAYNIENDDCNFDSGGPLVQNDIVIGIVSFESNCAKRSAPRIFTRISFFDKWFDVVEQQNGIKIGAIFKS